MGGTCGHWAVYRIGHDVTMSEPATTPTGRVPPPNRSVGEQELRDMVWDGPIELSQVLTFALPAYGDTWEQVMAALSTDPGDQDIVHTLTAELTERLRSDEHGTFDSPVIISFTDPQDWDEIDEVEFGPRPVQPQVRNGMHRITAAFLAGARWIWAASPPRDTAPQVHEMHNGQLVGVRAHLSGGDSALDTVDFAMGWLRSFRLDPDTWVETDVCAGSEGDLEWLFYCPHTLSSDLAAALVARGAEHGVSLKVLSATPTTWAELEAADPPGTATAR